MAKTKKFIKVNAEIIAALEAAGIQYEYAEVKSVSDTMTYKGQIIYKTGELAKTAKNLQLWAEKLLDSNRPLVTWTNDKYKGKIPQLNLPVGITCNPSAPCFPICYARFGNMGNPNNIASHLYHLLYYRTYGIGFFERIALELTARPSNCFRWHSSGDIVDEAYFEGMVWLANQKPSMQFLCYTKKLYIVNKYIDNGGVIPENLKIYSSIFRNFKQDNPHKFPETYVKEGIETDANIPENAFICGGDCTACKVCFEKGNNQPVCFIAHGVGAKKAEKARKKAAKKSKK